jgi:hypothetical protein
LFFGLFVIACAVYKKQPNKQETKLTALQTHMQTASSSGRGAEEEEAKKAGHGTHSG